MHFPSQVLDLRAVPEPLASTSIAPQATLSAVTTPVSLTNPAASPWSLSTSRRLLEIIVSVSVLTIFALPMLAIAILVKLTSKGPVFFVQKRVGRYGNLFSIYKFRTMEITSRPGPGLTRDGDCRITPLGLWLRKLKLDELPQFLNILRGEMSLVGPRPKLPQYEAILNMPYRPGITGAATLAFRREEEILRNIHPSQLDQYYEEHIKPIKARLDARYMCRATLGSDLRMLAATFLTCLMPARIPSAYRKAAAKVPAHAQEADLERGRETRMEAAV